MKKMLAGLGAAAFLAVWVIAVTFGRVAGKAASDVAVDAYSSHTRASVLAGVAEKQNQLLPRMLDSETRWDSVSAEPDDRYLYNYTMVDFAPGAQVNIEAAIAFSARLKSKACASPEAARFMGRGVTVVYRYRNNTGGALLDVAVDQHVCQLSTAGAGPPVAAVPAATEVDAAWDAPTTAFENAHTDLRRGNNYVVMQEAVNRLGQSRLPVTALLERAYAEASHDARWKGPDVSEVVWDKQP